MPYWTKKKLFSGLEIVEDIQKNGSEDEGDSSGLDSGDSLFEDALDHGIDPVADRCENSAQPPVTSRCT
ncbi:hypothetical protein JZ751_016006 [Albula glossodonta]|uniref:Uncharacterized protein n=1 Tax=Albula glossodonta TaxID=121402 RepID=A0A8T2NTQ4_9TELE|nr:hypothetical protein JZ751_016006 [Albula glossodonta]